MRRARAVAAMVLAASLVVVPAGRAEEPAPEGGAQTETAKPKRKVHVKDTVKEGAKTGGRTVRDGVLTFGRTTRSFFKGGTDAAKKTWNENAAKTKETAGDGAARTRDAAQQ